MFGVKPVKLEKSEKILFPDDILVSFESSGYHLRYEILSKIPVHGEGEWWQGEGQIYTTALVKCKEHAQAVAKGGVDAIYNIRGCKGSRETTT